MSQASQQPLVAATKKQQLNVKSVVVLLIVVAVVFLTIGVVSARGVASILSGIGHGLQNAAHWLDASIQYHPSESHSGDAIDAAEHGGDPDLYSPAEKARLGRSRR